MYPIQLRIVCLAPGSCNDAGTYRRHAHSRASRALADACRWWPAGIGALTGPSRLMPRVGGSELGRFANPHHHPGDGPMRHGPGVRVGCLGNPPGSACA
eukprot:6210348-Prymnesium_polylepis.1